MPSDDFARACGVPRDYELGGRTFRVRKLCPRDVGDLQRWFTAVVEDPRIAARDRLRADPDMPDEEARKIWVEAGTAGLEYPPDMGSDLGALLLGSSEGKGRLLYAVSRRDDPSADLSTCLAAGEIMTDAEHRRLWELISPGEIGDVVDPDAGGDGAPYTRVRAELCERYGWSFEHVDDMTFEAIRSAYHGGEEPKGLEVRSESDAEEIARNWRRFVRGL